MAARARITVPPKQSLGQNFLIDDNIARKIVRELHLTKNDVVVEVGPGHGALTQHLVGNVHHLMAVEIDRRVIHELKENFQSSHVSILHQDFLLTDLRKLHRHYQRKLRIVGNVPYHLTSPILFKIFDMHDVVQDITMMVQREVARRLVAKHRTKEYGILSVITRFYGVPTLLFHVAPTCFYPRPKVTSTIVHLRLHDELPNNIDAELFALVVKTAFGKRRKTLRNSLQYLPFPEEIVERIIHSLGSVLDKRPEQLDVDEFVMLTRNIEQSMT